MVKGLNTVGNNNGLIGKRVSRPNAKRLVAGRGRYSDDIQLPRMVHVAFARSPHPHARIVSIDKTAAIKAEGVVAILTGAELAILCTPWTGGAAHIPSLRSPEQHAMAIDIVRWQGEPVAAVVAMSRALAEDAVDLLAIDWDALPAVSGAGAALAPGAQLVHPGDTDNLAFEARAGKEAEETKDDWTVSAKFTFGRHTGVPLETRATVADWNPGDESLTVYASHQTPWQQQDVISRHLGIDEHKVRVLCPDVGGGFGIKLHVYGDEIATAALSRVLARPVKFVADRLESFVSDMHSRDHVVIASLKADERRVTGMTVDAVGGIGPYSAYKRASIGEGMMNLNLSGAPYALSAYSGRFRAAFQNRPTVAMYRAVGQPIATAVTEQLVDLAAAKAGVDPAEFRRNSYIPAEAFPTQTLSGVPLSPLSLDECLDKLLAMMDYDELRREQAGLRENGIWRGIGLATFVELTAVGGAYYGPAQARVSTQDGATVKLEPTGKINVITSVTDQGQGTPTGILQIVGDRLGVGMEDIAITFSGDTAVTPYGGGAWASRGLTVGGEAAWRAADALAESLCILAGAILQTSPQSLDVGAGGVCDRETGDVRMSLAEVAEAGHFRHDLLPPGTQPELAVTRHYAPQAPFCIANGIQGALVEVDLQTGFVTLMKHWVVEDCGRVINPLLVDEQIRGGVVQGIGGALFEHCIYDDDANLLNGTLADYMVPMAAEMPDIEVGHVETLAEGTQLGAKGAGEAGTVGAPAAIMCAVNDALRSHRALVTEMPMTPEVVLKALNNPVL
ncbi:MAG: xanthine dehydrogenase family protein molybdopterin-binding subunit [Alphaproteobacteria bacterium]|jgi:carbon-monoxide dehydrogenase large subunit|nr:xanthine dehydrogenase family protein molybdopterin-binding subunit [Alphaproteobacteria bacterium]